MTIILGLGGRAGTGGVPSFGGASSAGGAVATGGSLSTSTTECTAGRCLVTLAAGRELIWPGIAVDDASVYWTEHSGVVPTFPGVSDGRVMKVSADGGTPAALDLEQDFPSYIRVAATGVYWTTWSTGLPPELFVWGNASVMRALPDGSKTSSVVSLDLYPNGYPAYGDIAVDGSSVYWTYQGTSSSDRTDGAILRVSLVDGSTATLAAEQRRPYQIAVDDSSLYWVNGGPAIEGSGGTSLMKMPLAGGAITTLNVSPSGHKAIVLDASHVYWTSGDGTVIRMPLDGGDPVTMASGQSGPVDLAVDGASVYWANREDGTILRLPLAGGTPARLVSGQPSIQALAVDAASMYWTTAGTPDNDYHDGTVMKLTPK